MRVTMASRPRVTRAAGSSGYAISSGIGHYVRDLCTDVPYQVPILTVAPVPHGTVNATYSVERSGEGGASLKILGSGGGAGFKTC